ncbi:MAG: hypothetical protein ACWGON_07960, partial [Gemmatimonadota bacterium]
DAIRTATRGIELLVDDTDREAVRFRCDLLVTRALCLVDEGDFDAAAENASLAIEAAGGLVEGGSPGRASWLVSARGLHGKGAEPFIEGGFPQEYADGLLRLDVNASEGDTILISGYWNRETIFLGPDGSGTDSPGWGNQAAALRFKGDLSIG